MKRSTNVIVSNLSGDKILLSTFYTGPFLLFGKKKYWGGTWGPPAPPLATALVKKTAFTKISQFVNTLRPQTPSQITSPISAWYSFFRSRSCTSQGDFRAISISTQCLEFLPTVHLGILLLTGERIRREYHINMHHFVDYL